MQRFLVIDETNDGEIDSRHDTLAEAMAAADKIVAEYRDLASHDGEWDGEECVLVVEVRQCWELEPVSAPEWAYKERLESVDIWMDLLPLLPQIKES